MVNINPMDFDAFILIDWTRIWSGRVPRSTDLAPFRPSRARDRGLRSFFEIKHKGGSVEAIQNCRRDCQFLRRTGRRGCV